MKIWIVAIIDGSERDPESAYDVSLFSELEAAKRWFLENIEPLIEDQSNFVLEAGATLNENVDWFEVSGEGDRFQATATGDFGIVQLYSSEVQ